jgi:hypothetical protein
MATRYKPDSTYFLNCMQGMAQYFRLEHDQQGQCWASSMAALWLASGSGRRLGLSGMTGYSG